MFYISGFIISILIYFILNNIFFSSYYEKYTINETNKKLLSFIEGTWFSSINDMCVDINVTH